VRDVAQWGIFFYKETENMDDKIIKSPLTHKEQLEKIIVRGCVVEDEISL
jgi:hypothetical protein